MSEIKFKGQALNYNVFILPIEEKQLTDSGLDLTSNEDKNAKYKKGKVVSVGNLCPKNDDGENIVNVGDTIMYDRYKASDLKQDFIIYHSVYFSDLIMIIKD